MMDVGQLMTAALKCETRFQALELVRRETAAVLACFEGITEDQARTKVLGDIAYSIGAGMTREQSARVMKLFEVEHPYFGGDISKWPRTVEETFAMGFKMGQEMRNAR